MWYYLLICTHNRNKNILYCRILRIKKMANAGGGAKKAMDNDDNERAKGKQIAGATSSM